MRTAMAWVALTGALASADVATAVPESPSQQPDARPAPTERTGRGASMAAMRSGRLACGTVITRSTTLTADVGPCAGDGVIVGADGIMLNLNGHTISGSPGPGSGNDAGIRLPNRTGVRITGQPGSSGRRATVTGFDAGVVVGGGSGNTVENLNVRDNVGPPARQEPILADGIVLFHSAKNRLINNVLSRNGEYDGIGVLGHDSNDNLIRGNTVEDTLASEGELVFNGTGIIINNFLDEEGTPLRGEPIRNNDVIDNVVRRNDNSGISNIGNIKSRIIGNTVQNNGKRGERCFLFPAPPDCRVLTPAAEPSNGIGVTRGPLAPQVTEILISDNTVTGNTGNGIEIGTEQNRIIGNVALDNGGSGAGAGGSGAPGAPGERRRRGPPPRFDLVDRNSSQPLFEGSGFPPSEASCDQNVWHQNIFETAFPECAEETGPSPAPVPPPDPTCSDGIDNDGDGFTDGEDFDCGGPPPPDPGLDPGLDPGPLDPGP